MGMFTHIVRLSTIIISLSSKTKQQETFAAKKIVPLCGSLPEPEKQRMLKYGLYVPLFIGTSYGWLRGKNLTEHEKTAITALGCMTSLFDDLFDSGNYNDEFINELLQNPGSGETNNPHIKLLIHLYNTFLECTPHKTEAKKLMIAVFNAQKASRQQLETILPEAGITAITEDKGGYSMQLYRTAFSGKITKSENQLFYKLGAIGQLENDIFDIHDDFQNGIKTLATTTNNIDSLRATYRNMQLEIFDLIKKTNFKRAEKRKFEYVCALIIARGYVALNQLKNISKRTEEPFNLSDHNRNDLVCDMESPLNRVKLLFYAASCIKK